MRQDVTHSLRLSSCMAATEGADLTLTGNSPATAEIVAHAFAHVKRLIWL